MTCGPLKRQNAGFSEHENRPYNAGEATLGIFAREGDAAGEVVMTRPLHGSTGDEHVFESLRGWIRECREGHKKCQLGYVRGEIARAGRPDMEDRRLREVYRDEDVELPTRVLDVGATVRLVEAVEIGGRGCYAALSHCWGQSQHVTTTQGDYAQRKAGIVFSELPKTFRDAVMATRKLGVQYLWIDSLCIIQDSASDWAHESQRMGAVYHNAYFTIAASSSVDGDGGLFYDRTIPDPTTEVSLPFTITDGTIFGTWTIHSHPPNYTDDVLGGPLHSRAWTLQEKQLSRRTIHFTPAQVYLECKQRLSFENGQPATEAAATLDLHLLYGTAVLFRSIPQAAELLLGRSVDEQWQSVVEDYTRRALTYQKDKLPGLGGLVRLLGDLTGDVCYAGLWRASLLGQLLWRTASYADKRERRGRVVGRAPSWSWASMDGAIYTPFGSQKLEKWHGTDVVKDVQVVNGSAGGSMDENGVLELKGWTTTVRRGNVGVDGQWDTDSWVNILKHDYLFDLTLALSCYEFVRSVDHNFCGWVAMDERTAAADEDESSRGPWKYYPLNQDEDPELECLFVRNRNKKGPDEEAVKKDPFLQSYFTLFLRKLHGEDAYRRVGMGQMFKCKEFDVGNRRSIRVV